MYIRRSSSRRPPSVWPSAPPTGRRTWSGRRRSSRRPPTRSSPASTERQKGGATHTCRERERGEREREEGKRPLALTHQRTTSNERDGGPPNGGGEEADRPHKRYSGVSGGGGEHVGEVQSLEEGEPISASRGC